MTISKIANSAWAYSSSGGTTMSPTYPTNAIGDRIYLVVYSKASVTGFHYASDTISGWTEVYNEWVNTTDKMTGGYTANGADTGNMSVRIFYKDVTTVLSGTLSVPTTNNNIGAAMLITYRRTNSDYTWDTPQYNSGWVTATPTSPLTKALTNLSNWGLKNGDFILAGMAIPTDVTTPAQFSAQSFTHTGSTFGTFAEISEADTGTGNDMGGWIGEVPVTGGTDTAQTLSVVATLAGTLTNVRGPVWAIRLREIAPPPADAWATFVDAFDTKDTNLWNWPGSPTDAYVSGSSLFVLSGVILQTTNKYSLANSSIYFEHVYQGTGAMSAYLHLYNGDIATGTIPFISNDAGGLLYLGIAADYSVITYDPVAHRYFRIMHDGTNNILFQTSPDGATWTTRHTSTGWSTPGDFYLSLTSSVPAPYQEFPGVNATSGPPPAAPTDYWGAAA